ncbi:MAG: N(4)-(beta-N-acetylglucosaminyl)-L-asparaginase [Williamsia sp.]|nr:N(4)-(beta-N-acetylglucosaminyl)-L-asparaginase [Williamsia sp.]
MLHRRKFFQSSLFGSAGLVLRTGSSISTPVLNNPVVITTWEPNANATSKAYAVLEKGGRALDAVEQGVMVTEADPKDQSVGYGGLPDRDGKVTLDACVMDEKGNCGAVMAMESIMHAVSVARLVMEKTPHVQLVGDGALQFALSQGFKKQNLLTPESERLWKQWLKKAHYDPMITVENELKKGDRRPQPMPNHDTIGMIALDKAGNLGGACSTSGMAFKMHGRVGDSPIIGAGLFVDNEVGAATSTGVGEEVMKVCGSHAIIELMRAGYAPEEACRKIVERVAKRLGNNKASDLQVAFIALDKKGNYGGFSLIKPFTYVVKTQKGQKIVETKSLL